jgi:hypothetical protein
VRLRPPLSGLLDTFLVVFGAGLLTIAGELVVGHVDLRGIVLSTPRRDDSPTFPATMPLAAAFFVVTLQLTLVSEGWPLRRLVRRTSRLVALVGSGAIALALYLILVRFHPEPGTGLRTRNGPISGGQLPRCWPRSVSGRSDSSSPFEAGRSPI